MHGRARPYTHVEEVPLDLLERGANMAQGDAPEAAGASEPRDFFPPFSMTVKARARFFLAEEEELKAGRWALGRPRARVHVAYAKGRRPLPGGPGLAVRTGQWPAQT